MTPALRPLTPLQALRNDTFLRDYHRKYHPVIHGDIKFGFCFGNDETPLTPSAPNDTTARDNTAIIR